MRFRAWAARRHGRDALPAIILSRRIYILPTRYGLMLAALVVAMLIAGLNYNSNLGLAFAFLMASLAVVAMHHCHRNLLGLKVDIESQIDAFAGSQAALRFALRNDSILDRRDIEIRCTIETTGAQGSGMQSVPAKAQMQDVVGLPVARRGVIRLGQFEMHTRYPFGWFHAWTYVYAPLTVFAAPRPSPKSAARRTSPACAPTNPECRSSTWHGRCWRAVRNRRCAATRASAPIRNGSTGMCSGICRRRHASRSCAGGSSIARPRAVPTPCGCHGWKLRRRSDPPTAPRACGPSPP